MQSEAILEQYYLEKFILEVSIATLEQGGVTSNLETYQFLAPIDAWGLPRYPERTRVVPPGTDLSRALRRFIQANIDHLRAPGSWLGTWMNPFTHCCHLDITEIYPTFEEAHARASLHNATCSHMIVAMYNFKHDRTVYLQEEPVRSGD